jgi:4-hydroxybenzoate polyprenyltransferase
VSKKIFQKLFTRRKMPKEENNGNNFTNYFFNSGIIEGLAASSLAMTLALVTKKVPVAESAESTNTKKRTTFLSDKAHKRLVEILRVFVLPFFLTMTIYNLDLYRDAEGEGEYGTKVYFGVFVILPAFITLFSLALITYITRLWHYCLVLAGDILFGAFYTVPLLCWVPDDKINRVKDIPLMKPFLIAFCWTVGTLVSTPYKGKTGQQKKAIWAMLFMCFIHTMCSANLFDSMDVEEDRIAGVQTWSVVFGKDATFAILHALNALRVAVLCVLVYFKILPRASLGLLLSFVMIAIAIELFKNPQTARVGGRVDDLNSILHAPSIWLGIWLTNLFTRYKKESTKEVV